MIDVLATVLTYVALAAAAWALVLMIANRPMLVTKWFGFWLLGLVALLELGLIAQLVGGVINLAGAEHDVDKLSFIGYLAGTVIIVPLATVWSMAERSRWGPGVLLFGCLVIPVMIVRLRQIWDGHG